MATTGGWKRVERASWVVTVIGVPFAVISFLIAARQVEESRKALEVSAESSIYEAMGSEDSTLVEHPELRPYFYEDEEVPGEDEPVVRHRVLATAELLFDFFDLALSSDEFYRPDRAAWESYIGDMFSTSPALNEVLAERCDWWTEDLFEDYTTVCDD